MKTIFCVDRFVLVRFSFGKCFILLLCFALILAYFVRRGKVVVGRQFVVSVLPKCNI